MCQFSTGDVGWAHDSVLYWPSSVIKQQRCFKYKDCKLKYKYQYRYAASKHKKCVQCRNSSNKHFMDCEAQLAWKCLFTPTCKSLCASVTICATLVNIQTDRQTAFWPVYMNSSARWAKSSGYRYRARNTCKSETTASYRYCMLSQKQGNGEFTYNVLVKPEKSKTALCSYWLMGAATSGKRKMISIRSTQKRTRVYECISVN